MHKDDAILAGSIAGEAPIFETGDVFDADSNEELGHIDITEQPVPITIHIYINGWWYEYKVASRQKHELPEQVNPTGT